MHNTHDSRGFAVECTYHWTTVGIVWEAQPHSLEIRYMLPMVFECWKSTFLKLRLAQHWTDSIDLNFGLLRSKTILTSAVHLTLASQFAVQLLNFSFQFSCHFDRENCGVFASTSKKLLEQESHGSCNLHPRKIHLNQILVGPSYGHTVCQGLLLISICSYTYYIDMQMTMRYYYRDQIRKYLKKTPISINWCMHNSQFGQFSLRGS